MKTGLSLGTFTWWVMPDEDNEILRTCTISQEKAWCSHRTAKELAPGLPCILRQESKEAWLDTHLQINTISFDSFLPSVRSGSQGMWRWGYRFDSERISDLGSDDIPV